MLNTVLPKEALVLCYSFMGIEKNDILWAWHEWNNFIIFRFKLQTLILEKLSVTCSVSNSRFTFCFVYMQDPFQYYSGSTATVSPGPDFYPHTDPYVPSKSNPIRTKEKLITIKIIQKSTQCSSVQALPPSYN